ncbi:hypothetical protein BGZ47_000679, partial [Haplosporangium gracile]
MSRNNSSLQDIHLLATSAPVSGQDSLAHYVSASSLVPFTAASFEIGSSLEGLSLEGIYIDWRRSIGYPTSKSVVESSDFGLRHHCWKVGA